MRAFVLLMAALASGGSLVGCETPQTSGTNTNWLRRCSDAVDCDDGASCVCQLCTALCATDDDCGGGRCGSIEDSVAHCRGTDPGRICLSAADPTAGDGPVFLEEDGRVVIEAEHYFSAASGTGAFAGRRWRVAAPDSPGQGLSTEDRGDGAYGDAMEGPEVAYRVEFSNPGTYFVALRGSGVDDQGDSVHVGVGDVVLTVGTNGLDDFPPTPAWRYRASGSMGAFVEFDVVDPGVRVIRVWLREDGISLDRLLLTRELDVASLDVGADDLPESPTR